MPARKIIFEEPGHAKKHNQQGQEDGQYSDLLKCAEPLLAVDDVPPKTRFVIGGIREDDIALSRIKVAKPLVSPAVLAHLSLY